MKNNHTQLKRLAAISLCLMMCLSSLAVLAPSASAADTRDIIYGHPNNVPMIRSPSPLHDELLAPTYNEFCGIFDITSDGTIYAAAFEGSTSLVASTDGGKTFEMVHDFGSRIYGVYVSTTLGKEYIWVSTLGGAVYRSADGGATFDVALQMASDSYALSLWSFSSHGDTILIGEYGVRNGPAAVYMSQNAGVTWTQVFNTSMINPDLDAHIHLVSIDPYTGWYYVANGDDRFISSSLWVSKDSGQTWVPHEFGSRIESTNGMLGASYPDPYRVLFYTDVYPEVYEYIKSTGEIRLALRMPDPYYSAGVKTYCAVTGEHGVSYMSMTEYGGLGLGHIWLTIDGSSWYLVDGDVSDTKLLRIHDGIVYGRNIQFRDLTKEEAAMLIDEGRRSVEMLYDSPRHMYFDQPLKNVQVTITGKTITNYLTNPSFEEEVDGKPSGWTIPAVVHESNISEDVYYHGSKSLALNKNPDQYTMMISQALDGVVLSGRPLYFTASYRMDNASEAPFTDPMFRLNYRHDGTDQVQVRVMGNHAGSNGGKNHPVDRWMHYTGVWVDPPEGAELKSLDLHIYSLDWCYLDSVSISEYPIFVEDDTPSGNVSFMLGDHLIEAGELAEGESKTISLPSNVWLDGLVPIVPVTGLAYTVSIDGTPVSESEQSIHETNKLLEQTIPLIIGLAVIGGLFTMVGKAFGRLKF